ncbi:MAG TPA: glycosyltransferase [Bacteroidia bacterium]
MQTKTKSILFVLPRFPLPTDKGDKLRAWEQIKVLSKSYKLYVICFHDLKLEISEEHSSEIAKYVEELRLFPIGKWDMLWAGIRTLSRKIPFQVAYYYHPWFKKELEKTVKEFQPDFIFYQLIRVAPYLIKNKAKTVLDIMDCMSHNVYLRLATEKGIAKLFWTSEYKRLLAYESKIIPSFDYACIISERDRKMLPNGVGKKVITLSNGIDTHKFKPGNAERKTDVLFVGNLSYKPNIEACIWLVEDILPELHKKGIYPSVKLVGSSPDKKVLKLAEVRGVEVFANVPDTVPYYQDAKIMAAPMRINTGQQNKILEAMACACNVITTSNANDGIQAPDHCILVADESKDFAAAIESVLNNEKHPAQYARAFVEERFSWEAHTERFFRNLV